MITREDLLKDDAEQSEIKKQEELKKIKQLEEYRKRWNEEELARVDTLLSGELSDFLIKMNRKGIKEVFLESCRCWQRSKYFTQLDKFKNINLDDLYDDFNLKLYVTPKSPSINKLCDVLNGLGFNTEIITRICQNTESYASGDGYEFRDLPGTYNQYYLRIWW